MVLRRTVVFMAAAVLALMTVDAAHARSTRIAQIPNGSSAGCSTCHESSNYAVRNTFGQQVEANLEGTPIESADVVWLSICDLDADGDGESNGAELGDPCCTWADGEPALETVSLPGDDNDASGNSCNDGMPVDGAREESIPGDVGCPLLGAEQTTMGLLFVLSLGRWRRRRQL